MPGAGEEKVVDLMQKLMDSLDRAKAKAAARQAELDEKYKPFGPYLCFKCGGMEATQIDAVAHHCPKEDEDAGS